MSHNPIQTAAKGSLRNLTTIGAHPEGNSAGEIPSIKEGKCHKMPRSGHLWIRLCFYGVFSWCHTSKRPKCKSWFLGRSRQLLVSKSNAITCLEDSVEAGRVTSTWERVCLGESRIGRGEAEQWVCRLSFCIMKTKSLSQRCLAYMLPIGVPCSSLWDEDAGLDVLTFIIQCNPKLEDIDIHWGGGCWGVRSEGNIMPKEKTMTIICKQNSHSGHKQNAGGDDTNILAWLN